MIIQNITQSQFTYAFEGMGRSGQFTFEGKKALFQYLEDLSEDIGKDIQLDVIALCCEFNEYDDLQEAAADYTDVPEGDEAILDWFRDRTQVIEVDGGGIILQVF